MPNVPTYTCEDTIFSTEFRGIAQLNKEIRFFSRFAEVAIKIVRQKNEIEIRRAVIVAVKVAKGVVVVVTVVTAVQRIVNVANVKNAITETMTANTKMKENAIESKKNYVKRRWKDNVCEKLQWN